MAESTSSTVGEQKGSWPETDRLMPIKGGTRLFLTAASQLQLGSAALLRSLQGRTSKAASGDRATVIQSIAKGGFADKAVIRSNTSHGRHMSPDRSFVGDILARSQDRTLTATN